MYINTGSKEFTTIKLKAKIDVHLHDFVHILYVNFCYLYCNLVNHTVDGTGFIWNKKSEKYLSFIFIKFNLLKKTIYYTLYTIHHYIYNQLMWHLSNKCELQSFILIYLHCIYNSLFIAPCCWFCYAIKFTSQANKDWPTLHNRMVSSFSAVLILFSKIRTCLCRSLYNKSYIKYVFK